MGLVQVVRNLHQIPTVDEMKDAENTGPHFARISPKFIITRRRHSVKSDLTDSSGKSPCKTIKSWMWRDGTSFWQETSELNSQILQSLQYKLGFILKSTSHFAKHSAAEQQWYCKAHNEGYKITIAQFMSIPYMW